MKYSKPKSSLKNSILSELRMFVFKIIYVILACVVMWFALQWATKEMSRRLTERMQAESHKWPTALLGFKLCIMMSLVTTWVGDRHPSPIPVGKAAICVCVWENHLTRNTPYFFASALSDAMHGALVPRLLTGLTAVDTACWQAFRGETNLADCQRGLIFGV